MKAIRTALPFNKGWGAVGFLLDAEREFLDSVLLSSHLEERTDELEENEETKKRKQFKSIISFLQFNCDDELLSPH